MNQHYEFWVRYYQELNNSDKDFSKAIMSNNARLTQHEWQAGTVEIKPSGTQRIHLQVGYPGLLVGLGNSHGSGRVIAIVDEDHPDDPPKVPPEIKLGMTLDSVTGLPYLPGSTVKGLLRSAFLANRDYVQAVLGTEADVSLREGRQVEELELDIFGHQHPHHTYEVKEDVGQGRDVFFDAWPVKPDEGGHLLGLENITPHRANDIALDGLTEPNPLTLLKVMPGVVFLFRFQLTDTRLNDGTVVTADQKLCLFRQLLLDLGAGAKTNVGFGMLAEPEEWIAPDAYRYLVQVPHEHNQTQAAPAQGHPVVAARTPDADSARLKRSDQIRADMTVAGRLKKQMKYGWFVELVPSQRGRGRSIDGLLHVSKIPDGVALSSGQEVLVKILSDKTEDGKRRINLQLVTEGKE